MHGQIKLNKFEHANKDQDAFWDLKKRSTWTKKREENFKENERLWQEMEQEMQHRIEQLKQTASEDG